MAYIAMHYHNRKNRNLSLLYINSIYSHHMHFLFVQSRETPLSMACIFVIIRSKQRR